MRSASVERIFFILRKRPRDHRERKTEEDSNKIACDLAVVLWSHGPKVTKIKTTETTETTGTERPRDRETERPREDAISLIRDLTVVTGSQGHRVTRVTRVTRVKKNFSVILAAITK